MPVLGEIARTVEPHLRSRFAGPCDREERFGMRIEAEPEFDDLGSHSSVKVNQDSRAEPPRAIHPRRVQAVQPRGKIPTRKRYAVTVSADREAPEVAVEDVGSDV